MSSKSQTKLGQSLSKIFKSEERIDPKFFSRTSLLQLGYGTWANLSALVVGLTFGFSAVAMPQIKALESTIKVTLAEEAWITSVLTLSAPISCIACGYCLDIYGRRIMLILGHVPLAIGWIVISFSLSPLHLIIGRIICGLGVGVIMTSSRVYITEITLPNMRGILGATANVTMALGFVVQALMGSTVKWPTNSLCCGIFSIVLTLANTFLPETPYFVLMKKDEQAIIKTLKKFRAKNYQNLNEEMDELMDYKLNNVSEQSCKQWLAQIISESSLKPFFLMVPYIVFSSFAGINIFFFYNVEILAESHISADPFMGNVLMTCTRVVGAIYAAVLIFHFGRRPLSLISAIGCGVLFIYLGAYLEFYTKPTVLPLIVYIVWIIFANTGYYPLPMTILNEMLPLQVRGIMAGLGQAIMQFAVFASNEIFPFLKKAIKLPKTLIVMGVISLICAVYLYICLPETKRLTLQEIEEYFNKKRPTLISQRDLRANFSKSKTAISATGILGPSSMYKSVERHKPGDADYSRINSMEASKRRMSKKVSSGTLVDKLSSNEVTSKDERSKLSLVRKLSSDEDTSKDERSKKVKEKGIVIKDDD